MGEQTFSRRRCRKANYATIRNYLAMELRYMDAGERPKGAWQGYSGIPGYQ
jgi:hypothetical protein